MKIFKKIVRVATGSLLFILLIVTLPYTCANIYDFPEPKPFSGDKFYNPYKDLSGKWFKANFQAHSGAWGGLTDGKIPPRELYQIYKEMGYDIVGLTNYQTITNPAPEDSTFIPMYEHGYNVKKRHHLVIGAKEVVWLDYIFYQSIHHKQDLIKKIRPTTEIIAISHPKFSNSFEPADFIYLTDYDFIEILNHYRLSLPHWDSALSSGRLAWGMGDDDSHNQKDTNETGRYWNMILSSSNKPTDIIKSLKAGKSYSVMGRRGINENELKSVVVENGKYNLELGQNALEIRLIGQGGDTLAKLFETNKLEYQIKPSDAYFRAEIVNKNSVIFLNPVIRYYDNPLLKASAEINIFYTILYKILIILICIFLVLLLIKTFKENFRFYTLLSIKTPTK